MKRVKPLDIKLLYDQIRNMDFLLFAEEQIKSGGVSEHIIADMAVMLINILNSFWMMHYPERGV